MIKKILQFVRVHRVLSAILAAIIILIVYFGFKHFSGTSQETRYVLAAVTKGTIISSITGSGQVSASQQIDIKPKASGTVTYISMKAGQQVYTGQALAYLDSRDAQHSVRDAQISLESAQIALEKMQHNQQSNSQTTADDLNQSYKDAINKVSDAFLKLPNLIDLSRGILYDNTVATNGCGNACEYGNLLSDSRSEFQYLVARTENDYKTAKAAYDPNFDAYQNLRLDASPDEITTILATTEKTSELMAQAVKSEQNMLDTLVSDINNEAAQKGHKGNIPSQITTYQSNIGSAIGDLNTIVSNLNNAKRTIDNAKRSLDDSTLTNPIDIRSQENVVAQKQAALADARENLANYTIRAPFTGKIAATSLLKGDTVSGATVIATLISPQEIAEISLNEVEITNIKLGQKATLTFDAAEGLSITGTVIDVDAVGTVSQGVVTYKVKIGFDTQDSRIKPGMSVSASIITDSKQDVLLVPNGAVKSSGGNSYVEVPQDNASAVQLMANASNATGVSLGTSPKQQSVDVGLTNDSMSEVLGGLKEGDIVVVRTVSASKTATTTQTNSLFGGGGRTTGTGAGRAGGGGTFQQRLP